MRFFVPCLWDSNAVCVAMMHRRFSATRPISDFMAIATTLFATLTAMMFLRPPRVLCAGCNGQGAWPWRKPA